MENLFGGFQGLPDPLMYVAHAVILIGIYSILSISLNLEFGEAGLINFGKVAFFMLGAYLSAMMAQTGTSYLVCAIFSTIFVGIIGLFAALPALRLREDYLAIAMFGFAEVARLIFKNESWLAGGVWGIAIPPAFALPKATPRINASIQIAAVYLILLFCFIFARQLVNSPYGRILRALREDELATKVLGKDVFKFKIEIFAVSSAMAGLAGSLFAQYMTYIDPSMFEPTLTFSVFIMVILGGPGNNLGAIMGALLVGAFERGASILKDYVVLPLDPVNFQHILIGILIILVIFLRPQGLLRESKIRTPAHALAPGKRFARFKGFRNALKKLKAVKLKF